MARKRERRTGRTEGTRIAASEFKARCLELMDRVRQTRQEITVTKYGRPVAKLVPLSKREGRLFGHLRGTLTRYGDLIRPIEERWEADG